MKVLIIGTCVIDAIIQVDHIPASGQDVYGSIPIHKVGGCAYNMACAMQKAGVQPDLLVNVGNGAHGQMIEQALIKRQLTGWVKDETGDNGICYCLVEPNGQRTFISCQGVDKIVNPDWFTHLPHYDWILFDGFQLTSPDAEVLINYLESSQSSLFFCPGPVIQLIKPAHWNRLMALDPIIHLNEDEYELVKPLSKVIITQGNQGCTYIHDGHQQHFPANPVPVVDTIGAGDAHAGTLLAHVIQGDDWPSALSKANLASSEIVQIVGAVQEE